MVNDQDRIELNQNPTVHGVRPAIDVTMASVAARYKEASIGVVLTGMGRDGTNGSVLIQEAGVANTIAKLPDAADEIEKAVNGNRNLPSS